MECRNWMGSHPTWVRWAQPTLLLVAVASTTMGADQRDAFDGMAARPYRVSIRVAIVDDPRLTPTVRDRALAGLAAACRSTFGAGWNAEVARETTLPIAGPHDLEVLDASDLGVDLDALERPDKVYVVTLAVGADALFHVAAREFDTHVRGFGHIAELRTGRDEHLGRTLFNALHDTYRPISVAVELENDRVDVRRLAGEFTLPDASAATVREGTLLVPYLRYLDKQGEVGRVLPIDWTYLRAESVEGTTAVTTTISGLRSPMGTRVRSRVQVIALAVRPRFDNTRVVVAPRTRTTIPASGVRVRVIRKLLPRDESEVEPLELMTDRRGFVDIPRDDAHPLTWLYVHSGDELLARVPLAAGVEPKVAFGIPDDRHRLSVEGRVEILQADLIDVVAARETLLRRLKIHQNQSEWSKVDPLIAQLKALPTAAAFEQRLESIRATPLSAATNEGNGRAVHGIERIVSKTRERIRKYLDPARIDDTLREIEENRGLDVDDLTGVTEPP